MTRKQLREHKLGNQVRRLRIMASREALHFGLRPIQAGRYTEAAKKILNYSKA